nr:transmembrane channel-like protein 2 isoform X1 [Leptinotarsa decemlineata]
MMLFLCVLPVGYTIVWIRPSWHCGPFSKYKKIFHIFTETIKENSPERFRKVLDYIASPGIVIPLLVLLTLIIYYLISLTSALREANDDLKIQLRRERTEERRKMFQMTDRRRRVGSGESNDLSNTPFSKWKKVLGDLPSGKSLDETPKPDPEDIPEQVKEENGNKSRDFFTKLIKRALGKSSTSEDEPNAEDGTDTEQHDSLPYDTISSRKSLHRPLKPSFSWGKTDFQTVATKAMQLNKNNPDPNDNRNISEHSQIATCVSRQNSDLRKDVHRRKSNVTKTEPSFSDNTRQDSESSVWSENIPVITISKTESAENILSSKISDSQKVEIDKVPHQQQFAPKIKCALKKQSTEIDEETIRYFNKNIEENRAENELIRALAQDESDVESISTKKKFLDNLEEPLTDVSSSEGTEYRESSTDTVLHTSKTEKIHQN